MDDLKTSTRPLSQNDPGPHFAVDTWVSGRGPTRRVTRLSREQAPHRCRHLQGVDNLDTVSATNVCLSGTVPPTGQRRGSLCSRSCLPQRLGHPGDSAAPRPSPRCPHRFLRKKRRESSELGKNSSKRKTGADDRMGSRGSGEGHGGRARCSRVTS